jgi:predicted RNase H-like nuclease (RuvC/YqgF family)
MDDFIKRIKKEINKGITVVSAKSKELVDTAKINNQVTELNDRRNQTLQEIGLLVYQMSLTTEAVAENVADNTGNDTKITDKCKLVAELDQQIEEKELELKKLRTDTQETLGKAICESCGAAMEVGTKYCSNCGARMVTVEK